MGASLRNVLSVLALVITVGCGGGSSNPPTPPPVSVTPAKYLYVTNTGDATISAFSISSSGSLTQVQGSPFAAALATPTSLAFRSDGVLYVGTSESPQIQRFLIELKSGKISNNVQLPGSITGAEAWTNSANLFPCGSRLYVFGASYFTMAGGKVGWGFSVYNLNSDGSVSASGPIGMGTGEPDPIVSNVAMDSSCFYNIHAQTGSNTVVENSYDATNHSSKGYLPVLAGTAPVAVATDLNFKFLFVANSGSNDLSAFAMDPPSGTLTPVAGSPYPVGSQPSMVLIVNSFVYVTSSGDNTVSAFSFDSATGVLTQVPGSPFPVGTNPVAMTTASTDLSHSSIGQLLYVANQGSNDVSAFAIATGGVLQRVAGSPFPVGHAPKAMVVAIGPQ